MVSVAEFLDNAGDDDSEMDENGGLTSKHMKLLGNSFGMFEGYCKELAVFGFNSAGYVMCFMYSSRALPIRICTTGLKGYSEAINNHQIIYTLHTFRTNHIYIK